jgi:hypothetical protein
MILGVRSLKLSYLSWHIYGLLLVFRVCLENRVDIFGSVACESWSLDFDPAIVLRTRPSI